MLSAPDASHVVKRDCRRPASGRRQARGGCCCCPRQAACAVRGQASVGAPAVTAEFSGISTRSSAGRRKVDQGELLQADRWRPELGCGTEDLAGPFDRLQPFEGYSLAVVALHAGVAHSREAPLVLYVMA